MSTKFDELLSGYCLSSLLERLRWLTRAPPSPRTPARRQGTDRRHEPLLSSSSHLTLPAVNPAGRVRGARQEHVGPRCRRPTRRRWTGVGWATPATSSLPSPTTCGAASSISPRAAKSRLRTADLQDDSRCLVVPAHRGRPVASNTSATRRPAPGERAARPAAAARSWPRRAPPSASAASRPSPRAVGRDSLHALRSGARHGAFVRCPAQEFWGVPVSHSC
jgi:hypothetical protein